MDPRKAELLARLEDVPALVEVRGLLGRNGTSLVMSETSEVSGFVFAPDHDLAAGFGQPAPGLGAALAAAARTAGIEPGQLRVRADPGVMEAWCAAGAGSSAEVVEVFTWSGAAEELAALAGRHEARILTRGDEGVRDLPGHMRRELEGLESWPAAAVATAGGEPVAMAYAFVETETLWDVSVATEAAFRREGFGACAAAALMLDRAGVGLAPVWSVSSTNRASIALAERLGFVPAARWGGWRLP
ncbi:MAG: GNAT family N-acetyltransferase [Planctomycetota bacterium]|nr:GNAT family N-acetyltransferase [Planctomycetota bacterium]MDG1983468.1 GNAT family N-acetyltransferase [Planctomycetota bacterium]